jgi:hypothetical protein
MEGNRSRRRFIQTTGVAATVGMAGCMGVTDSGGESQQTVDIDNLGTLEASEEVDIDFWISIGAQDLAQGIADGFNEQSETITVSVSEEGITRKSGIRHSSHRSPVTRRELSI